MGRAFLIIPGLLFTLFSYSQINYTARDFDHVLPYTDTIAIGMNPGYYPAPNYKSDEFQAELAKKVLCNTIRMQLTESFLHNNGYGVRLSTYQYLTGTLGFKNIQAFFGQNGSEQPTPHRDTTKYPGAPFTSLLFLNMYEPIFLKNGQVNPRNYCAKYIWDALQIYGPFLSVVEVVNEPDIPYGYPIPLWWTRMPKPGELKNLQAPLPMYIRFLKIAYLVTKTYNPKIRVTPGGVGFTSFLDCLLRYTDNPVDGSVTPEYPYTGGAYFDLFSYHVYPFYRPRFRDKQYKWEWHTNSDAFAEEITRYRDSFQVVFDRHGYDNVTYPKKPFMVSEVNIPDRSWKIQDVRVPMSGELSANFTPKLFVQCWKSDIKITDLYLIMQQMPRAPIDTNLSESRLYWHMGPFENGNAPIATPGDAILTPQGKAMVTWGTIFPRGFVYSAERTEAMNMPKRVKGAAFTNGKEFRYIVWADTFDNDSSEVASATYSFPQKFNMPKVRRYMWNYSDTDKSRVVSSQSIPLTGAPVYFTHAQAAVIPIIKQLSGRQVSEK